MATLTLNSNNLPDPTTYIDAPFFLSSATTMANGSVRVDLLSTSTKRKFTLKWTGLSSAEKTTVETAFDDVKSTTQTFTDYASASFTVRRGDEQNELAFTAQPTGSGIRWNSNELILVEV